MERILFGPSQNLIEYPCATALPVTEYLSGVGWPGSLDISTKDQRSCFQRYSYARQLSAVQAPAHHDS